MANYLYNGVELPDINEVWTDKETYPYAVLGVSDGVTTLMLMTCAFGRVDTSNDLCATDDGSAVAYELSDGSWTVLGQMDVGVYESLGAASSAFWTSHDIIDILSGTVYLAASDPVDPNAPTESKLKISVGGGNCLYNGVELPDIEAVWTDKTTYPYACICDNLVSSTGEDFLYLTDGLLSEVAGYEDSDYFAVPVGTVYQQYTLIDEVWTLNSSGTTEKEGLLSDVIAARATFNPIWANYSVLNTDGTVYLAASEPVAVGGVTDTTATVSFSCSDLESTESVYQIKAWVYKTADGLDTTVSPTWTSGVFAGPSHTESHTFEGLSPNTEHAVYGVIYANGEGTDNNATATFTTLEGEEEEEEEEEEETLILITDRTINDVNYVLALAKKQWSKMSDEERSDWLSDLKGCYNASDLNRVGKAVKRLGLMFDQYGYKIDLEAKTDWETTEFPLQSQMDRYLLNIKNIRSVWPVNAPNVPPDMRRLTYEEANDIERILLAVKDLFNYVEKTFIYSGEAYSGEF